MADYPDKVEKDEKEKIERAISELEKALKTDNKDDIEAKNKILAEASQKLSEKIHADQQAAQAQPKEGGKNKEKTVDAEVVDAEFEEVKKDNKKDNKKK
jgi:molecular chaperone DnaK